MMRVVAPPQQAWWYLRRWLTNVLLRPGTVSSIHLGTLWTCPGRPWSPRPKVSTSTPSSLRTWSTPPTTLASHTSRKSSLGQWRGWRPLWIYFWLPPKTIPGFITSTGVATNTIIFCWLFFNVVDMWGQWRTLLASEKDIYLTRSKCKERKKQCHNRRGSKSHHSKCYCYNLVAYILTKNLDFNSHGIFFWSKGKNCFSVLTPYHFDQATVQLDPAFAWPVADGGLTHWLTLSNHFGH